MPQLNPDLIIHGRYQLQRPIGRGGFSIVWLALDLNEKNKPVALKISLPDKDPGGEQPIRMKNQHNTTRHLEHPHLLRSHDFFMIEDAGCLVFDYMAGGTLHSRVKVKGPLAEPEITKVMIQIGGALQFLHEHSLVHFDVKPENILIDAHGDYFLSDFDTASRLENAMVRVSRIYADTPQYRSPEHLRGASELSEKVDIFAFGTTLFELCEGMMEKELGIGMMLLSGANKPELTEGNYPKRLENLIQACWNFNPADRPSADAIVSYGEHVQAHNFWPAILEYNPNDKAIADLPTGRGAETARVTIGKLAIPSADEPEIETKRMATISPLDKSSFNDAVNTNTPVNKPATPFIPPVLPPKPKSEASDMEKKETNYAKVGLIALLGLTVVLGGAYFIRNMMKNNEYKLHLQEAIDFKAQNKLKDAYDAVMLAREINPDDTMAIKQRWDILRIALEQHTNDLDQVRGTLASNDASMYEELCQRLNEHKDNASILRGDDSTAYFMTLIPGCTGAAADDPGNGGTISQNNPSNVTHETTTNVNNTGNFPTPSTTQRIITPQPPVTITTPPVPEPTDPEAEDRKKMKEELNDWSAAKIKDSEASYKEYLLKWPEGMHVGEANNILSTMKDVNRALSNSKSTGLPLSEHEQGTCLKLSEGGSIRLTPGTVVELAEFTLFSDAPGKVQVILQDDTGKKIGSVRCVVSNGLSQCNLTDLNARLKPGKSYQLIITPLRNDKGAIPSIQNMKSCSPNFFPDPNLKVDYQGSYILFDLKYNY